MSREFFRRFMPSPQRVDRSPPLRLFGRALQQPNLWHLNRRSVARAMLVGLFWTLFPMPFQMIPGIACAIAMRANLGLALVLIWLTNPITFPPVLYVSYLFGRVLLNQPRSELAFEWSWRSVVEHMGEIWRPLYVGAITAGIALGVLGCIATSLLWRRHVLSRWRKRQRERLRERAAGVFDNSPRPG
jgi:uncharacterized protein